MGRTCPCFSCGPGRKGALARTSTMSPMPGRSVPINEWLFGVPWIANALLRGFVHERKEGSAFNWDHWYPWGVQKRVSSAGGTSTLSVSFVFYITKIYPTIVCIIKSKFFKSTNTSKQFQSSLRFYPIFVKQTWFSLPRPSSGKRTLWAF